MGLHDSIIYVFSHKSKLPRSRRTVLSERYQISHSSLITKDLGSNLIWWWPCNFIFRSKSFDFLIYSHLLVLQMQSIQINDVVS